MKMLINDVTDTALWIAAYRAQETERTDAVFRDWLAARLAGARGYHMAATMPHTKAMAFAMVVRTAAIDRLVTAAISQGIDTVINLGAGLDTRPYRMNLPVSLRWIEVDFPATIQYKNEKLAGEGPVCRLERIAMDLANESQREMLFCQLGDETRSALVITEGLIPYLTNAEAALLSRNLHAIPSFKYWIQDYNQGRMGRNRQTQDISKKHEKTQRLFTEPDPVRFFGEHGWKVCEDLHILDEADRIGRRFPTMFPWRLLLSLLPRSLRQLGNNAYGYVMFAH
jgi:methyltransferase (TIGR00027 family)